MTAPRLATATAIGAAMALILAACGSNASTSNHGISSGARRAGVGAAQGSGRNGGQKSDCHPPSLAHCFTEATMQKYVNEIVPDVEGFYKATWAHPLLPDHIYFVPDGQAVPSKCEDASGNSAEDDTAYAYCPADNSVYLGQSTLWQLYSQAGDVAPAIGLAHELAHEQQHNAGIPDPKNNAETISHENQADCLSGAWFSDEMDQGAIQAEDFPSTERYLEMIASAENDPNRDHGDLQQRLDSFLIGKDQGPAGCNKFYPDTPIITSSLSAASPHGPGIIALCPVRGLLAVVACRELNRHGFQDHVGV